MKRAQRKRVEGRKGKGRNAGLEASMAAKTEDIDTKLVAALEALRNDRSIPATREKLAELAGCSPGAIRYRTKAVEALRAIKTARKATKAKPPKSVEQELRAEVADLKSR